MTCFELVRCDTAGERLTLESLASAAELHPGLVEMYVAYGLVPPLGSDAGVSWFDVAAINRVQAIRRLRRDLGLNLAGIAVAFELLSRIEKLQRELADLRPAKYALPTPVISPNPPRQTVDGRRKS